MSTRPKSRGPAVARLNMITPMRIRAGAISATSKDSAWTISVVPTLAPSITASAGIRSTSPPAAKPVTIRPVAVLLWTSAVTPMPARNAFARLPSADPRKDRSRAPKARCTPVCTMWTPQRRSATEPASFTRAIGKSMTAHLPALAGCPRQGLQFLLEAQAQVRELRLAQLAGRLLARHPSHVAPALLGPVCQALGHFQEIDPNLDDALEIGRAHV